MGGECNSQKPALKDAGAWDQSMTGVGDSRAATQVAHAKAFEVACENAVQTLVDALKVLTLRLSDDKKKVPTVDSNLDAIAKDEDTLSKQEKLEKEMFEGQQEYSWDRALSLKVQEQAK